jgi:hypothetical protein
MDKQPFSKFMFNNQGKMSNPYVVTLLQDNLESGENAKWLYEADNRYQEYCYSRKCQNHDNQQELENQKRIMRILEPNLYKGELGIKMNPFWINTEEVFIVNGEILKADGDFIEGDDEKNVELKEMIIKQSI